MPESPCLDGRPLRADEAPALPQRRPLAVSVAPPQRRPRRLYAFALALGLGIGSAYWALAGEYPFGGVAVGPWTAWPAVGSREADPYARTS